MNKPEGVGVVEIYHQSGPSPCCKSPLIVFPSGGSNNGTKGPYVSCHNCKKEYPIDYKTGVLKL